MERGVGEAGKREGGVGNVRDTWVEMGKEMELLGVPQRRICISLSPCAWVAADRSPFSETSVADVPVAIGLLEHIWKDKFRNQAHWYDLAVEDDVHSVAGFELLLECEPSSQG